MVEYDSVIPPGRVGKLTQKVNLSGYSEGDVHKSVRVVSNAENDPDLRLSVKVHIKPIIGVSTRYLRMTTGEEGASAAELTLRTEKEDLEISEAAFSSKSNKEPGPSWQADLPIYLRHELSRSEEPDSAGLYEYSLGLKIKMKDNERHVGTFRIKTNHPNKRLIEIRGMIVGG
mgnify:CR=1 FL=1